MVGNTSSQKSLVWKSSFNKIAVLQPIKISWKRGPGTVVLLWDIAFKYRYSIVKYLERLVSLLSSLIVVKCVFRKLSKIYDGTFSMKTAAFGRFFSQEKLRVNIRHAPKDASHEYPGRCLLCYWWKLLSFWNYKCELLTLQRLTHFVTSRCSYI